MSEIKYFLEKKRDRPRGLVAGRRGRGSVTGCLINFIFLTLNNLKVDGPRPPNFFRRGTVACRARSRGSCAPLESDRSSDTFFQKQKIL